MKGIKNGPLFGSHQSAAGGLENALVSAGQLSMDCVQLFVKNQRQWAAPPLKPEQIEKFAAARVGAQNLPVMAHASYLVNLAAPDESILEKSIAALGDELRRCDALGIAGLVVHPGAALHDTEQAAIRRIAASLDEIARRCGESTCKILLESTAGQGSSIGHRLEHLADIRGLVLDSTRIGYCLDTCHLFAAGYDFRTPEDYAALMNSIDQTLGLDSVQCLHINDSKRELGSRVDRHEHIGKGKIGNAGFAHFVNDPRLRGIPMILETPKGTDARGVDFDKTNLRRLRSLLN